MHGTADNRTPADATANRLLGTTHLHIAGGVAWALATVVIWSAWAAYTRLSVTRTLTAEDLVALRYAVGGVIMLPVLIGEVRRLPISGWREGLVLAFCQGAPLALLVTAGLVFAPAAHMTSLSPGLLPLFAALIGLAFYGEPIAASRVAGLGLIIVGALALAGISVAILAGEVWKGDLMFVCAGLMGSTYAVRMRRSGLTAMQGAALISVYSMLFYLPLYGWRWLDIGRLALAPTGELLFQAFYQGVLMGAVALFTFSRAIMMLGAARAAAFMSLVPVLGTVLGAVVVGEVPTAGEIVAVLTISVGVLLAAGAFRCGP